MTGSIDKESCDQSWSTEVDVNRLRQIARCELSSEEERAMYRLIRTFDPWKNAFADALVDEYHAWSASMTPWERFRYRLGNCTMSVRSFLICRLWDLFPTLDPENRPNPVDEWIRRDIERDLNEADGVKSYRKN